MRKKLSLLLALLMLRPVFTACGETMANPDGSATSDLNAAPQSADPSAGIEAVAAEETESSWLDDGLSIREEYLFGER